MPRRNRALVIAELLAVVAIGALLAVVLIAGASESRRQASLSDNLANLKQFGLATGAYGADNDDRIWAFSWQPGVIYEPGLPPTGDTIQAAATQAWHILRTRTGRPEWFGVVPPSAWMPHILFSHLVVLDYLDTTLPERSAAAPEDHTRLLWQSDPFEGFLALPSSLRPPGDLVARRWPFSSSYFLGPAAYAPDAASGGTPTVSQIMDGAHNLFTSVTSSTPLGMRRLTHIDFPAQKVLMHEEHQRHFGPRIAFFAHEEARVPLLLADGSAAVRRTGDTNPGFQPNDPLNPAPLRITYRPQAWEPPTLSGGTQDLNLVTHYRFTRSGLRGRDFGGPEIPWTP